MSKLKVLKKILLIYVFGGVGVGGGKGRRKRKNNNTFLVWKVIQSVIFFFKCPFWGKVCVVPKYLLSSMNPLLSFLFLQIIVNDHHLVAGGDCSGKHIMLSVSGWPHCNTKLLIFVNLYLHNLNSLSRWITRKIWKAYMIQPLIYQTCCT